MDCKLTFAVENFLAQNPSSQIWTAYSGGLDSHVLLHILTQFRANVRALHVNHNLSPHAKDWVQHCAAVCLNIKVEFFSESVDATAKPGESPEAYARELRYAVFEKVLQPQDLLFCAHHQDDQAETLILQLIRGSGLKGLAAMPLTKKCGPGLLVRPLLDFTRSDLEEYARTHNLKWIEDESNQNKNFTRNFLRQDILPLLKQRWPGVTNTLARTAAHCMEAQTILDEVAVQDLQNCLGENPQTLSATKLKTLSPGRQSQLLRYWLQQQGHRVPGSVKLQQIQRDIIYSRSDKVPHVAWTDAEIRRYRDDIFCMPQLEMHNNAVIHHWDTEKPLRISAVGTLHAEAVKGRGLKRSSKVTVRFRQGGEECRLPKRAFTHSLKKLLWEWNIPPWERDRMPLIFVADELAAIPNYFVSDEFAAQENEEGLQFTFARD